MTRSDLRRLFGMVLQDTWLFSGTVRDNIIYGRDGASEERMLAAAKAARVDHFVRTLPQGYDTVLDEDATAVSQGEKQLLTIARAFLADPDILILDEATSSVDTRTEVLIQQAMSELMKDRTSFVIAHRLSTIRGADIILCMDHGHIVEQGSHEELLARRGFYFDLYNAQFAAALTRRCRLRRRAGRSGPGDAYACPAPLGGLLALLRAQHVLAHAHRVGRDLDELVGGDPFQGALEREGAHHLEAGVDVLGGLPVVAELLALGGVAQHVVGARVLAHDHALVDALHGPHEQDGALLQVLERIAGRLAARLAHQRAAIAPGSSPAQGP